MGQRRGVLVLLLFFLSCGGRGEKPVLFQAPAGEYPDREGWNATYRITQEGRPQVVIRYGHMTQYENRAMVFFDEGVQVDFFDSEGRHRSVLTAERGTYHEKTGDVYGLGRVVIVSDTGIIVYTEKIRWDQRRSLIVSDTTTTIIQEGDTIQCQGFESYPDLSRIVLKGTSGRSRRRVELEKIRSELTRPVSTDSIGPASGREE